MRRALYLLPALLLASGCHLKFKKHAPTLGEARVQIVTLSGPYVDLGELNLGGGDDQFNILDAVDVVVNVAQAVNEVNQAERIANAVNIEAVNAAMQTGYANTLQSGPPFAYTDATDAHTLQLSVESWGLNVPYLGAQGEFTYTVKARLYKTDGERVYSSRLTCSSAMGAPDGISQVLGTVNNVDQMNQLSDEQISGAFEAMAEWCGSYFVTRMRKHAG